MMLSSIMRQSSVHAAGNKINGEDKTLICETHDVIDLNVMLKLRENVIGSRCFLLSRPIILMLVAVRLIVGIRNICCRGN